MTAPRTITISEAAQFWRSLGGELALLWLGDEDFALPTRNFMARFAGPYSSRVRGEGSSSWLEKVFDCENHAMRAVVYAIEAHRATFAAGRAPQSGLAIGELWLASRQHAIVACIHEGAGGVLEFQAYEPQLAGAQQIAFAPVELTPEDFAGARYKIQ